MTTDVGAKRGYHLTSTDPKLKLKYPTSSLKLTRSSRFRSLLSVSLSKPSTKLSSSNNMQKENKLESLTNNNVSSRFPLQQL